MGVTYPTVTENDVRRPQQKVYIDKTWASHKTWNTIDTGVVIQYEYFVPVHFSTLNNMLAADANVHVHNLTFSHTRPTTV